jgi:aromatic-L-amino-acid/L-tryptophan decarboxylase
MSLEPTDWDDFRRLAHRMVDDVIGALQMVRDRPVWKPVPDDVKARLRTPIAPEPQGAEDVYSEFMRDVFPYPRGNTHPRFWGWVNGSGIPLAMMADFLASAMNSSVGAFENSATMVEEQVIESLRRLLELEAGSTGVLTSGCSMSNLIALAAARHAKAGFDVRNGGIANAPPMTLYASEESHCSIQKAVELLGLGRTALRLVAVDRDRAADLNEIRLAVDRDRRAGFVPICVVGNAGTASTGAIDRLDDLARYCADEGLWLHIDGAFGALAWLCEELRPRLTGLRRADSLAFDLHKWMYMPYDIGCVFMKDGSNHQATFSTCAAYLSPMASGPSAYPVSFPDRSIETTRRFRALKAWFCMKAYGTRAFAEAIRANVGQAQYLAELVAASEDLELCSWPPLNVVCFRFRARRLSEAEEDDLNRDILIRIQTAGLAMPSHTVIGGRPVIRAAVTNHRSTEADFEFLVAKVLEIGARILKEHRRHGRLVAGAGSSR